MRSLPSKLTLALGAAALLSGSAALAAKPSLPENGHYVGYALVVSVTPSATGVDCSNYAPAGSTAFGQLELNTVNNVATQIYRTPLYGTSRVSIEEFLFKRALKSTRENQTGTVTLRVDGIAEPLSLTYTATLTPIDPNSFNADMTVAGLPPNSGTGTCAQENNIAFVRSSAD